MFDLLVAQGILDARKEKSPLQIEIKVSESKDDIYLRLQAQLRLKRLELIKIGFDNYIEGLLIYPQLEDLEEFTIKTDNLLEGFEVGESTAFPVEIRQENFLYILDDDGSIFVNVENLTDESFKQAGTCLIRLGMALYNKI